MLSGQYDAADEYLRRAINESPVYFPKAQENLNTLSTLKSKQIIPIKPELNTPSSPVPAIQSGTSTTPDAAQIHKIEPKTIQSKPPKATKKP